MADFRYTGGTFKRPLCPDESNRASRNHWPALPGIRTCWLADSRTKRQRLDLHVISGDDRLGAGYIILFIGEPELLANPEYGNPETAVLALLSYRAGQPIRATGQSQDFYGAHVFTIEGAGKQGYVLYHYYAHTPDQGYTLTIQVALSDIERSVSVSGAVASSIVCNTALRPPSNGYYHVETANPLGTSERCKKQGQCNDSDLGGTYNVQLGTGWVHSSSGQNYLVDVTTDYRNDGPEGPGYYRQNGNNLEKLEPGFN